MKLTRLLAPLALAGLALTASPKPSVLASASASYAGTWHISGHLHCIDSPKTAWACGAIIDGSAAVFSQAGTTFDAVEEITVKGSASGKFTFTASETYTQSVAHGKAACNSKVIGVNMNGSCTLTESGNGHVAAGRTHRPDFFTDHLAATFHGHPITHASSNNVSDTGVPAAAGHWNAASYLKAIREKKAAPAAVTFSLTVSKS